jgi:hypothetical protein
MEAAGLWQAVGALRLCAAADVLGGVLKRPGDRLPQLVGGLTKGGGAALYRQSEQGHRSSLKKSWPEISQRPAALMNGAPQRLELERFWCAVYAWKSSPSPDRWFCPRPRHMVALEIGRVPPRSNAARATA